MSLNCDYIRCVKCGYTGYRHEWEHKDMDCPDCSSPDFRCIG